MLFNNSEMFTDEDKEESAQNIFPQLILSSLRIIPSHFVLPLLVLTTMTEDHSISPIDRLCSFLFSYIPLVSPAEIELRTP